MSRFSKGASWTTKVEAMPSVQRWTTPEHHGDLGGLLAHAGVVDVPLTANAADLLRKISVKGLLPIGSRRTSGR
jgi:hypothetical protein